MNDNRHIRNRIIAMEREQDVWEDKIKALETVIRDKDKVIASLSIYKYNALHRKHDGECKACAKREFEEQDAARRSAALDLLPTLDAPLVHVIGATSAELTVQVPAQDSTIDFSRITILYSTDAEMILGVSKKIIKISSGSNCTKKFAVSGLTAGAGYIFAAVPGIADIEGNATQTEKITIGIQ